MICSGQSVGGFISNIGARSLDAQRWISMHCNLHIPWAGHHQVHHHHHHHHYYQHYHNHQLHNHTHNDCQHHHHHCNHQCSDITTYWILTGEQNLGFLLKLASNSSVTVVLSKYANLCIPHLHPHTDEAKIGDLISQTNATIATNMIICRQFEEIFEKTQWRKSKQNMLISAFLTSTLTLMGQRKVISWEENDGYRIFHVIIALLLLLCFSVIHLFIWPWLVSHKVPINILSLDTVLEASNWFHFTPHLKNFCKMGGILPDGHVRPLSLLNFHLQKDKLCRAELMAF